MSEFLFACLAAVLATLFFVWTRHIKLRRKAVIRNAVLPKGLFERLRKHHPDLSLKDCQLVASGLRHFFLTHLKSGRQHVAMPSQVVDDLWREFILHAKNYDAFCARVFGRFLHHTPAAVMSSSKQSKVGLPAAGGTPAARNTSTRARPRAYRCCLPSMQNLALPVVFNMSQIAGRCAAKLGRLTVASSFTAAATFPTCRLMEVLRASVTAAATAVGLMAVMGADAAGAEI